MRFKWLMTVLLVLMACPVDAQTRMKERERDFLTTLPLVGDAIPDVTVYAADGTPFSTSQLRGHYTVLTFGCLTCPPSIWNIAGLEAVHRDYHPKGVKFFFIFKSLAHPELAGNYIQPFTIEERLLQANQAKQQFGTQIPWIVDAIDNRLKRALGDRPNSQFLIDPQGIIVRKRAWSHPGLVRKDLEELVGPVEQVTRVEDLQLKFEPPSKPAAARGVVARVPRNKMTAIVAQPTIDPNGLPFYAKLRAEADAELLSTGTGSLYLGFHLDPLHRAAWNNLTEPLSIRIDAENDVVIDRREATAAKAAVMSDSDPREFLLNVKAWPADQSLTLTVTYFACVDKETCHEVQQQYRLQRARDIDGGGARGEGAGYWDTQEFTKQLLSGDQNRDGLLQPNEAVGLVLPHFEELDRDADGSLDRAELKAVGEWLNTHHRPGVPGS
ncbi:MAG: peroxiredoxin family protein [Planctomycetaceae bacterium]